MKNTSLPLLACPACHSPVALQSADREIIQNGVLNCPACSRKYPVKAGIPHFITPHELTGFNRRFSRLYDWFSLIYPLFSKITFATIGLDEGKARREITDRLEPHRGRVLEVSIGPGVNLPYLLGRPDLGEMFGLDISPGQLQRCQAYVRRKGWSVDLFLANGEQIPFQDGTFKGVLHVGGINFFNDKKAAIDEMIRVASPGARILIADETEKGAVSYERILPGFKASFHGNRTRVEPPFNLVPAEMLERRIFEVWKGWFYCLEFRKP
jgi:ubiquinone/menaquinone biosynthesis C-methylase UbiE/uncharacterized protein YbaR (Trm112 family)